MRSPNRCYEGLEISFMSVLWIVRKYLFSFCIFSILHLIWRQDLFLNVLVQGYRTKQNRALVQLFLKTWKLSQMSSDKCKTNLNWLPRKILSQRYTNADLKISLHIQIYLKIAPWKFRIFNRKNFRVINP